MSTPESTTPAEPVGYAPPTYGPPPVPRSRSKRAAVISGAMAIGLLGSGALVWQSTNATFTGTAAPAANSWTAGRVSLSADSGASALFSASGLVPGSTGERCVVVTYGGDVATSVKLFASSASGSLNEYIRLRISLGTGGAALGGPAGNCTGFSGSQFFQGSVAEFAATATNHQSGLGVWNPNAPNTTKTYRFVYELDAATPNDAQGTSGWLSLSWEARATA